jgi:hypothetical protein
MLEIGIQKNNLETTNSKKNTKNTFDQKYTGFDLRTWEGQSENWQIIFYASYENRKQDLLLGIESKINFILWCLSERKDLYAIQLVEGLLNKGSNVGLNLWWKLNETI